MVRQPRFSVVLLVVAVLGLGVGLLVGRMRSGSGPSPTTPAAAPAPGPGEPAASPYAEFRIADFDLTTQDGQPADAGLFEGRVTVLTFFFTSCPDPCPAIQRAMADVQQRTAGTGVRLVSISVDGEHDTPERVRAYATGYGADFSRWVFLTGDPEAVAGVVRESIRFEMRDREDLTVTRTDGSRMAQILHPTRLVLVGPDRRVLGLYAYNDAEAIDRLVAESTAAARAAGG